jgi:hypothetical protein
MSDKKNDSGKRGLYFFLRWFLSKHLFKFVFNLGGKQGQNERGGRGQQQTPT